MVTLLILFLIGSALVLLLLYTKPSRPSVAHGGHSSVDSGFAPPPRSAGFDAGSRGDAGVASRDGGDGGCDGG